MIFPHHGRSVKGFVKDFSPDFFPIGFSKRFYLLSLFVYLLFLLFSLCLCLFFRFSFPFSPSVSTNYSNCVRGFFRVFSPDFLPYLFSLFLYISSLLSSLSICVFTFSLLLSPSLPFLPSSLYLIFYLYLLLETGYFPHHGSCFRGFFQAFSPIGFSFFLPLSPDLGFAGIYSASPPRLPLSLW